MYPQSVDDSRDRPWNHRSRIIHSIAHRIADTDLHGNLILVHQIHQFQAEGDYETIDICPGDVFQMASRADPRLQAFPDDRQVMVHGLQPGHLHLEEDMIIRTADQDARFLKSNVFYQLEILLACSDPAGNLRKIIAFFHTFIDGIAVLFTIQEELALADLPIRASKTVEIIVDLHDLLRAVRRSGLLSVTESRIRDPDLVRHAVRHYTVIERDLGDLVIVEKVAEDVGFFNIHQGVHMLFQLQQVRMFIQIHFPIFHFLSLSFIGIMF